MSRLRDALEQIEFVRRYTLERLDTIPLDQWFTIPPGGVSHIAWQVGHIAMAEYRLCLERLRLRTPADESLISDEFLKLFSRETIPGAAEQYPAVAEIRAVFDRVHGRVREELPSYTEVELDLAVLKPHPLFNTRLASLRYAPLHEMLHCGQIGLLRRELGLNPVW